MTILHQELELPARVRRPGPALLPPYLLWLTVIAIALFGVPTQALGKPYVKAELLSEDAGFTPGRPLSVGLMLKMQHGWHVYWKNPGDSGYPVSLKWDLSAGVIASDLEWPTPKRIDLPMVTNYGYEGEVLLPLTIHVPADHKEASLTLRAKAKWLACNDTCVPEEQELELVIRPGSGPASEEMAEHFMRARQALPQAPGPVAMAWAASAKPGELVLQVRHPTGMSLEQPEFIPLEAGLIMHNARQVAAMVEGGFDLGISLDAENKSAPAAGILAYGPPDARRSLTFDTKAQVVASAPPAGPDEPAMGLLAALLLALLGGIVLNVMPCVLPVLSLKIMGFVRQAGEDRRKIMAHGLVFTAGVLVSFWLLVGVLFALKAGGQKLGWGFQLQNASFQFYLVCFLFIFSLGMLGVFEFGLLLSSAAGRHAGGSGLGGAFMNGVLATVLATPCTGPFMAPALGYALLQPAWKALLVFTSLGLGMSLPYLVLSFAPSLLRFLPKPGAWMETFKQAMAFPMLASVVFFANIYAKLTDAASLHVLLWTLLGLAVACWMLGRFREGAGRALALLTSVGMLVLLPFLPSWKSGEAELWRHFNAAEIEREVRAGRHVFVDYTAAWCAICQSNRLLALERKSVLDKFREKKVLLYEADWSKPDDAIWASIQSFGKGGVPLYVLYKGGDYEHPRILPQTLTTGIVIGELDKL